MAQLADTFHRALAALFAHDVDAYARLFAKDGTIAFPFAPNGWPSRISGREAIRDFVGENLARALAAGRSFVAIHDKVLHEVDGRTLIVELTVELADAAGGRVWLPYVHVYQVDETGQITELRDYYSGATPRAAARGAATAPAVHAP